MQDYFIERVNPDQAHQVEFQGNWEDVEIVEERIEVKGRETPIIDRVRITRHGRLRSASTCRQRLAASWERVFMNAKRLHPQ